MIVLDDPKNRSLVTFDPHYLSIVEGNELYTSLVDHPLFENERVSLGDGKVVTVARKSMAISDQGLVYRYAGVERVGKPWHPLLQRLRDRLERDTGHRFNFVLCNLYPDGKAGLGWHADNEPEVMEGSTIASISLGAEREFRLKKRGTNVEQHVVLENTSLLLMQGDTQQHYLHSVPKDGSTQPRLNFTFRLLRTPRARYMDGGKTAFVSAFEHKGKIYVAHRICHGRSMEGDVVSIDARKQNTFLKLELMKAVREAGRVADEVVCVDAVEGARLMRFDEEQTHMRAVVRSAYEQAFDRRIL